MDRPIYHLGHFWQSCNPLIISQRHVRSPWDLVPEVIGSFKNFVFTSWHQQHETGEWGWDACQHFRYCIKQTQHVTPLVHIRVFLLVICNLHYLSFYFSYLYLHYCHPYYLFGTATSFGSLPIIKAKHIYQVTSLRKLSAHMYIRHQAV